jgi:hypothetical protein
MGDQNQRHTGTKNGLQALKKKQNNAKEQAASSKVRSERAQMGTPTSKNKA